MMTSMVRKLSDQLPAGPSLCRVRAPAANLPLTGGCDLTAPGRRTVTAGDRIGK